MGGIRNLSCFVALASSITLCFSQSLLGPLSCPIMQAIPDASVLSIDFFSPLLSIDLLEPAATVLTTTIAPVGATTAPTTRAPNEQVHPFVDVGPTPAPPVQTQSFATNERVCFNASACYTKVATMSTSFMPTWNGFIGFERVISTPSGKLIAKLVTPGLFGIAYPFDTSQEVQSCKGIQVGRIVWDFAWSQLLFPGYDNARLQDGNNDEVAKIVTTSLQTHAFELQKNIMMTDPGGVQYASMQQRFGGINLGFIFLASKVKIQVSVGSPMSPPAHEPYVLALLFANQLAARMFFGPFFSIIVLLLLGCCCGACCFSCCCGSCKRQSRETKVDPGAHGETESLLSTRVSGKAGADDKSGGLCGCCTRYNAKAKEATIKQPPTLATHARDEFRSFTSGKGSK